MANFTMADVKKLREATGSGMMDVKKALEEADGDYDAALEALRIKGAKDVGKRAERTTAQGLVAQSGNTLLELLCETDFVAKNGAFIELAQTLVELADEVRPADAEAFAKAELDGKSVAEVVQEESVKLGEKLAVGRVGSLEGDVAVYMHRKAADLPPAVGVLVAYTGDAESARQVGMQAAAMRPKFLAREEVPSETVEAEKRVALEQAKEEGKPERAWDKIVEGKVNAYYRDFVLLEQNSVIDNKKTVKQVLAEAGTEVTGFIRFEVGQE
ncbi:translation elongation factor Ts [Glycomyces sp. TRM65418]|uniref:translation elongation factor Ts n=1 Tax=Glycomyces sp. TRM65418 TaxID=2867006 RepID=UPI001CE67FEC|nr:translation elongation factor Ts [Glycomyces sp. TRM65418]MCC3762207.1 translation elongation factor Ts [Glycomyces sp. TRM65418]QZD56265.1 translation elongation factor Ts [Glycomyces sp. TRM65418]